MSNEKSPIPHEEPLENNEQLDKPRTKLTPDQSKILDIADLLAARLTTKEEVDWAHQQLPPYKKPEQQP